MIGEGSGTIAPLWCENSKKYWHVEIFLTSESAHPVEIIRTLQIKQGEFVRLRGISIYLLVKSRDTLRVNGDKL
jgi:hypothetical protein